MVNPNYVANRDKRQLVDELHGSQPGSQVFEIQRAGLLLRCTEDLEQAALELGREVVRAEEQLGRTIAGLIKMLEVGRKQGDALGRKLFYLNCVLTAATVVAAVATLLSAIRH